MLNIVPSQIADLPALMPIIAQGQRRLHARGVEQWQDGYPTEEIIRSDIEQNHCYTMRYDDVIMGMMVISFDGEPTYQRIYEGQWITDGDSYGVVHRMAISDGFVGRGLAKEAFAFAENLAKERDVASVRVDTHRDNVVMNSLLRKIGYTYCGIIYLLNGKERLAYEKWV